MLRIRLIQLVRSRLAHKIKVTYHVHSKSLTNSRLSELHANVPPPHWLGIPLIWHPARGRSDFSVTQLSLTASNVRH